MERVSPISCDIAWRGAYCRLEDVWVAVALGEQAEAQKVMDAIPHSHPFVLRTPAG